MYLLENFHTVHKVLKLYPVIVILLLSISVHEFSRKKTPGILLQNSNNSTGMPKTYFKYVYSKFLRRRQNELFHTMAYIFYKKCTETLADTSKTKWIKEINNNCKKTHWLSAKVSVQKLSMNWRLLAKANLKIYRSRHLSER